MSRYTVVVYNFDSGLNELLDAKRYDYRTKQYRNPVKNENDLLCMSAIRGCRSLRGAKLRTPIFILYRFFCKNKKHDKSNVAAGFVKSFEDALQKCGVLKNDTWDCIEGFTYEFHIDAKNPRVEVIITEVVT